MPAASAILVFARAPVPGRTKTRLIPALGEEGAARLHGALVRHALEVAARAAPQRLELWGAGEDPQGQLATLAAENGAELYWQSAGDLGARMRGALDAAVTRHGAALVIGSDCPWLDAGALREAQTALDHNDAVLGPADDGGYVLIGMRRVDAALFEEIPWGTDRVLEITRARLVSLNWRWHELPARSDVDRPSDLARLRELGAPWSALAEQR